MVVYSWDARAARLRWLAKQEPTTPDLTRWTGCCPAGPTAPVPGVVLLPAWLTADLRVGPGGALPVLGRGVGRCPVPPDAQRRRHVGARWSDSDGTGTRTATRGPVTTVTADGPCAFPPWLGDLGRRAVADASALDPSVADDPAGFAPDVALVNWYGPGAKMGMHADRDERGRCPGGLVQRRGDRASSGSGTRTGAGDRGSTCPSSRATWWSSAARPDRAYHGVPRLLAGHRGPGRRRPRRVGST